MAELNSIRLLGSGTALVLTLNAVLPGSVLWSVPVVFCCHHSGRRGSSESARVVTALGSFRILEKPTIHVPSVTGRFNPVMLNV
jgi:hypothetical protein